MSNPETLVDSGGEDTATTTNGRTTVSDEKKIAAVESNNHLTTPHETSNGHCNVKETTSSALMMNGNNTGIDFTKGDDDDNAEEVVVEEDEEENLLMSLEEKAEQEADHEIHQPNAVEEAPRLLQAALKEGQVKADESEEEDNVAHTAVAASPEVHVHKRVRRMMSLAFPSENLLSHSLGMKFNVHFNIFVSNLFTGKSIGLFTIQGV